MKKAEIYKAWAFAVCFMISVVLISLKVRYSTVAAIIFMMLYLYWVVSKFPCPKCGKALSLQNVTRAIWKEYHCPYCGQEIKIKENS